VLERYADWRFPLFGCCIDPRILSLVDSLGSLFLECDYVTDLKGANALLPPIEACERVLFYLNSNVQDLLLVQMVCGRRLKLRESGVTLQK